MKTNNTCPKCNKVCKSEKALKQHNFMMHTHAGAKVRNGPRKPWGSNRKIKTPALYPSIQASSNFKSLAFCPCCGLDLRKVNVAMTM